MAKLRIPFIHFLFRHEFYLSLSTRISNMLRSPAGSQISETQTHPSILRRFRCPTCHHLSKTKSGWTKHIQSIHSELIITYVQSQNAMVMISNPDSTQVLPPKENRLLHSSPPTSPLRLSKNNDNLHANIEPMDFLGSEPEPLDDLLSLRPSESDSELGTITLQQYQTEYHPIISGRVV